MHTLESSREIGGRGQRARERARETAKKRSTHRCMHTSTYVKLCMNWNAQIFTLRGWIRGELVEFGVLTITCVLVSLACPDSSERLVLMKRSEEIDKTVTPDSSERLVEPSNTIHFFYMRRGRWVKHKCSGGLLNLQISSKDLNFETKLSRSWQDLVRSAQMSFRYLYTHTFTHTWMYM